MSCVWPSSRSMIILGTFIYNMDLSPYLGQCSAYIFHFHFSFQSHFMATICHSIVSNQRWWGDNSLFYFLNICNCYKWFCCLWLELISYMPNTSPYSLSIHLDLLLPKTQVSITTFHFTISHVCATNFLLSKR